MNIFTTSTDAPFCVKFKDFFSKMTREISAVQGQVCLYVYGSKQLRASTRSFARFFRSIRKFNELQNGINSQFKSSKYGTSFCFVRNFINHRRKTSCKDAYSHTFGETIMHEAFRSNLVFAVFLSPRKGIL